MSEWHHPTLADTGVKGAVRCRCGRRKLAEDMLDVRGLPGADGAPHLCSTCIETLYYKERLDFLTFHGSKGAPADWLARFEATLLAGPLQRPGLPQHVWGEILAARLDAVAVAEAAAAQAPVDGPAPPT